MTDRKYLHDPSTEGTAMVQAVTESPEGISVRLDQTWFHPQGGGQKSDAGTIANVSVLKVINGREGEVLHLLAEPPPFRVGDRVDLRVDRAVRLLHARWHTAGHLIASIGESLFPELKAAAGHQWPGEARVDFFGVSLPQPEEFITRVTPELGRAVADNLGVQMENDAAGNRAIRIGNFTSIGCGGTHVASLDALGTVRLRKVKVKGNGLRAGYDVSE